MSYRAQLGLVLKHFLQGLWFCISFFDWLFWNCVIMATFAEKDINTRLQMQSSYRVLELKCWQKNLNFFVCMIARIIWMVLIDHKFDTVLTDIEVGSVFCWPYWICLHLIDTCFTEKWQKITKNEASGKSGFWPFLFILR